MSGTWRLQGPVLYYVETACCLYCLNNQLSPFSCHQPPPELQLYQDYLLENGPDYYISLYFYLYLNCTQEIHLIDAKTLQSLHHVMFEECFKSS